MHKHFPTLVERIKKCYFFYFNILVTNENSGEFMDKTFVSSKFLYMYLTDSFQVKLFNSIHYLQHCLQLNVWELFVLFVNCLCRKVNSKLRCNSWAWKLLLDVPDQMAVGKHIWLELLQARPMLYIRSELRLNRSPKKKKKIQKGHKSTIIEFNGVYNKTYQSLQSIEERRVLKNIIYIS